MAEPDRANPAARSPPNMDRRFFARDHRCIVGVAADERRDLNAGNSHERVQVLPPESAFASGYAWEHRGAQHKNSPSLSFDLETNHHTLLPRFFCHTSPTEGPCYRTPAVPSRSAGASIWAPLLPEQPPLPNRQRHRQAAMQSRSSGQKIKMACPAKPPPAFRPVRGHRGPSHLRW